MGEVDPVFVQDLEHRPKLSVTEGEDIPLIDLSSIINSDENDVDVVEKLVKEIGSACREWGFFQVINHGVPLETRLKLETASRNFFALPLEEKRKVRRDELSATGYYDTELTKNVRDWKEVFDLVVEEPAVVPASPDPQDNNLTQWFNKWPQHPPEIREAWEEYGKEMQKLGLKLMGLIARSLGLGENRFNEYFKNQTSFIRLNHYPPCPSPHLALGVGRHKDSGAITVLAQDDVGGLQVKRKTDGVWIQVKPTPNAYIVNVGDCVQVWSNDKYESVEHRVMVNSEKERFSIPFAMRPSHYTMMEPLKELINDQNPPKFKPFSWGKFFTNKRLSNFKKLNVENLQIYHFRIQE
ncbi:hypothetical protein FNV43_RR22773 [Rhamnella rubrinervis]|uniref:Fe2OG dioxygenase domain-containing protein n=1 Tax=Rhamnella rubrinervis TaxID=2594499 RepID=A0A8K0E2K0_9ROSA|nr:hypothetical protein FNV43_RR22773 [Rhamnella rubrinervis]